MFSLEFREVTKLCQNERVEGTLYITSACFVVARNMVRPALPGYCFPIS